VILEAQGLAIGYRDRIVGRDLDVALAAGEVLALLGPNGGGKTTLLKTLLGLIAPLAGAVSLAGQPLGRLTLRERARLIAYVPQVHAGTFAFTVRHPSVPRQRKLREASVPDGHSHAIVCPCSNCRVGGPYQDSIFTRTSAWRCCGSRWSTPQHSKARRCAPATPPCACSAPTG